MRTPARSLLICMTLLLSVLTTGIAQETQGPTLEQTRDWIRAKFQAMVGKRPVGIEGGALLFVTQVCGEGCQEGKGNIDYVPFFNDTTATPNDYKVFGRLTMISYSHCTALGRDTFCIVFSGHGFRRLISMKQIGMDDYVHMDGPPQLAQTDIVSIDLNPGTSESDAASLVKALKHFADLRGTKLIDDNLFSSPN